MCSFCKTPFRHLKIIGNWRNGKTSTLQQLEADLIPLKTHRRRYSQGSPNALVIVLSHQDCVHSMFWFSFI
jgi:hypothetical protein